MNQLAANGIIVSVCKLMPRPVIWDIYAKFGKQIANCSQLIFLLTLGNFKRHKLTHSGVKAFGCQYCESKFTTPAGQKQHEKTHIGDKSYCCKLCDRSYVTSGKLRTHVLTVHAAKKPTCKFCEKTYVNLSKLKKHVLTKHADENPPNNVM